MRTNQRSLQSLGVGTGNQRVVDAVRQEYGPLNLVGIMERGLGLQKSGISMTAEQFLPEIEFVVGACAP